MTDKILLIEKNLTERERLANAIQAAGYHLQFAEDVASARKVLAQWNADLAIVSAPGGDEPDLGLVEWLRSRSPATQMPILILSEDITARARLAAYKVGANDYIARPFDLGHFRGRISNMLGRRESRASAAPPGIPRRILVVDDSPTYGYALSGELQKDGHDVAYAETGRDALMYLDSQKADLVILDVFLPDLNGVEVCRRIKASERTTKLPVLVLTGREKSAVRSEAAAANADEFAVKSTDLESIRNKVRNLLVRAPNRRISTTRLAAVKNETAVSQTTSSSGRYGLELGKSVSQRTTVAARIDTQTVDSGMHQAETPSGRMRAASGANPVSNRTAARLRAEAVNGDTELIDSVDLFESIVRLTGLSELLARSTVESVCRRLDLNARALTRQELPLLLEGMERALQLFLPAGEAQQRLAALNTLVR
jgi:DNA-binding response OmpR family regulator